MRAEPYFVYMLASRIGGTIYIGATGNLRQRISQHREKAAPGFTSQYGVTRLVWYEAFGSMPLAFNASGR
jgi:putative endonuclease